MKNLHNTLISLQLLLLKGSIIEKDVVSCRNIVTFPIQLLYFLPWSNVFLVFYMCILNGVYGYFKILTFFFKQGWISGTFIRGGIRK